MPLEATVVCLDNSEWMRNGDYTPTRMEAQHDAVNLICGAKTQQNPESTVGCIAGAGKSPEVLVTLTPDLGKMLSALHNIKLQPTLNFPAAVQVAQLVLKHRQNKNQQQRIIFFVGSPVNSDVNEMVRLAKRLKKNNIAVDIVNFGEQEENTEKLESFIQNVNNNENSHLVNIPPGPHILSDIIISSPIITGGEDTSAGSVPGSTTGTAAQDFSMYGGVDPNLDPELAMALKVSLEEARAQQEAQAKKDQPADATNTNTTTTTTASSETAPVNTTTDTMDVDDEAELAKALALSMTQTPSTESGSTTSGVTAAPLPTPAPTTTTQQQDTDMGELEDDEDMRLALQMSMQSNNPTSTNNDVDISKVMEDPNFVNSVLSSLPGVDPNDETIKNVLASIGKSDEKKDDKDKK